MASSRRETIMRRESRERVEGDEGSARLKRRLSFDRSACFSFVGRSRWSRALPWRVTVFTGREDHGTAVNTPHFFSAASWLNPGRKEEF